jgi:hypothetical protein
MTDLSETPCAKSPDDAHCRHWYDGEACHYCEAPAMTPEQKREQEGEDRVVHVPTGRQGVIVREGFDLHTVRWDGGEWESAVDREELRRVA